MISQFLVLELDFISEGHLFVLFLRDSVSSLLSFDNVGTCLDLLEHGPHLLIGDPVYHSGQVVNCWLLVQGRLPSLECIPIPPLLLE